MVEGNIMGEIQRFLGKNENLPHREKALKFIRQITARKNRIRTKNNIIVQAWILVQNLENTVVRSSYAGETKDYDLVRGEIIQLAAKYHCVLQQRLDQTKLEGSKKIGYDDFLFITGSFVDHNKID